MSGQPQSFTHTRQIDAASSVVYALLDDAENWQRWARPIVAQSRWVNWGVGHRGGVGGVRAVGLWPVFMREQIVAVEPGIGHTYTMLRPDLFDSYVGVVRITEMSDSHCEVVWRVRFDSRFGTLSGKVLRQSLSFVIGKILDALADAAEASSARASA